jgi:hypothetical protein
MNMFVRASAVCALLAALTLTWIGSLAGPATVHATNAEVPANLVPSGDAVQIFELGARGVQIYACEVDPDDANAYVWTFKAPEAELLNGRGDVVGSHFGGPTWQGLDGSAVIGEVLERADSPESGAIPWLLLGATEHVGNGIFSTITHIQRLDTTGGVAPAEGCDVDHAGEEVRVPYEATYAFYYTSPSVTALPTVAPPPTSTPPA